MRRTDSVAEPPTTRNPDDDVEDIFRAMRLKDLIASYSNRELQNFVDAGRGVTPEESVLTYNWTSWCAFELAKRTGNQEFVAVLRRPLYPDNVKTRPIQCRNCGDRLGVVHGRWFIHRVPGADFESDAPDARFVVKCPGCRTRNRLTGDSPSRFRGGAR